MPELTRRRALGAAAGAAAALAVAGTAAAAAARKEHTAADPASFDEVYKGRRIQGTPSHGGGHHGGHGGGHGGGYSVHIDGEELHVMRNADGTWISVVNHYEPFATPRAVARAAVAELQGADLVPLVTV
ncbi:tyrosinase [Streptomyces lunaelactis]|uniref:apotyrosinase chaperone MelC1 n=1 Tax=Streptomyces lunaelactis TaxID=1535768 RepID=UPI001585B518|nr:tyrosinase cofactor [Streptomyces lunaelactis]NUK13296.1 tyrosinase [Streptomyces lunaelactis]NUK32897.1 tyrosinase [Streptomyces lunaelactis]NUK40281.1 tyrosinase [Streptomyces lunaelactis]NUK51235.1 tyrosinase [Streptomyces lunaelactis]NUK58262.1 tyrosinase [Streptomyces lunaelactis]